MRPQGFGGRKPLQEAYARADRVKDALLGIALWLALSGLAAWLHHAASVAVTR